MRIRINIRIGMRMRILNEIRIRIGIGIRIKVKDLGSFGSSLPGLLLGRDIRQTYVWYVSVCIMWLRVPAAWQRVDLVRGIRTYTQTRTFICRDAHAHSGWIHVLTASGCMVMYVLMVCGCMVMYVLVVCGCMVMYVLVVCGCIC